MFICSQPLRAFFSGVFMVLLLASTATGQDKTSDAQDEAALSFAKQSLLIRATPEKADDGQWGLIDFTAPRLTPSLGLVPAPDRDLGVIAPDVNRTASGALRITLEEAQARAISTWTLILAWASVDAARYHRQAVQADYFPKVGAYFVNLH